jgi:hypothetical protein
MNRSAILLKAGLICLLVGCGKNSDQSSSADSATASRVISQTHTQSVERPLAKRPKTSPLPHEVSLWDTNASVTPQRLVASGAFALQGQPTGSSSVAQQLLTRLAQVDLKSGQLSPEKASELNGLLRQLREQGNAAVPAIRDFLRQNQDVNFDAVAGGDSVEYSSLRLGLIDALYQIGGPEAVATAAEALQGANDPLEIALLALTLEQHAPGQYRDLEVAAAKAALANALDGNWKGGDVSSLFETLQAVGDTNTVPLLKQAVTRWNYYATLALAGLRDGAGIPTLIQLAQDPAISSMGTGDFALRPLAQVAVQYPEAGRALVEVARQNRIPDSAWPTVSASLAGTYIQYGNQVFGSTAPALNWSSTEINQRITLIQQMLTVTASPVGRQTLQSALASLSGRLPK